MCVCVWCGVVCVCVCGACTVCVYLLRLTPHGSGLLEVHQHFVDVALLKDGVASGNHSDRLFSQK